jgi:hypothetical protein
MSGSQNIRAWKDSSINRVLFLQAREPVLHPQNLLFFFFFFRDRVSLCSPDSLELRNPPASASQVLGLKACATTPGSLFFFLRFINIYKYTVAVFRHTRRGHQILLQMVVCWELNSGPVEEQSVFLTTDLSF